VFSAEGSLIFVSGSRSAAFQALQDGGAILVSDPIARRDNLGIGSTVELAKPGADAHTFTVAGIIAYTLPSRSADGALLISLADARELFGANSAEVWAFVKQPGVTDAAFHDALAQQAKAYAAELLTAAGLSSDLERSLDRVIGLFDVLALLTVVIAALGIVNTLGVSVLERAREIAILRSHGMTTGQVQAMVVAEASIMGAIGGIAAVITGVLMSAAVVGGTASRDFGAGVSIPWPLLISVVLLGTGVAALAGLYPARIAARIPIVRTIAHHE
jgi:putative ABC transport system permease protein